MKTGAIVQANDEESSDQDYRDGVEILPRGGIVHRLAWVSNSSSIISMGNIVSIGSYVLRHRGRREHVCPKDGSHDCLSMWWIKEFRGSENTSYLPSFKEEMSLHFWYNIQVQRAFLRHCFITLKGLRFPCSCPIWTVALGLNWRAQLPSTSHQQWSMDGRQKNGPALVGQD